MQKYEEAKGMMLDLINGLKKNELKLLSHIIFNPEQRKGNKDYDDEDLILNLTYVLHQHE